MSERKGTKALELWCKRLVKDCPNVQIDNMTTSWRNGIAFCALVHHFRPDLIDMSTLRPENIYENNQLAFSVAEKHLGIPALLDPEDMVDNEIPDRLSMLTYLSQFYQRLGHTVTPKASESDTKLDSALPSSSPSTTPIRFGKTGLDKCAACNEPVYLAQRLMVDHKLYHRRCFRCSKCLGYLNPKNYHVAEGSDFFCDSCKNDKTLNKYLNNNDQMGMLAFTDDIPDSYVEMRDEEPISPRRKSRAQSILEKINMFENKDKSIEEQVLNLSLKDNMKHQTDEIDIGDSKIVAQTTVSDDVHDNETKQNEFTENSITDKTACADTSDKTYKTNINKMIFLQTQLSSDDLNVATPDITISSAKVNNDESCKDKQEFSNEFKDDITCNVNKDDSNVTDDIRIAKSNISLNLDKSFLEKNCIDIEKEIAVSVPPRRKKNINSPEKKNVDSLEKKSDPVNIAEDDKKTSVKIYPDSLNPFSDDEDEIEEDTNKSKKESTNPFGSTDEEDDDVPPIPASNPTPTRRLITANPFWSDGEEPSSDEESQRESANIYKSSIATSTPNLQSGTPRRKKAKAPPPPKIIINSECLATSMDDVASISSYSSYNSTDQKSFGKTPPMLMKRRVAPTPPDSLSTGAGGSMERGCEADLRSIASDGGRKSKGPAPGLPLPERREVKLQMSSEDLQVQLDMLETQQLGLERQGVLIEQMIRDKCEGDEPSNTPQEEVEDLVIQLCELVNEKNDLFRKQTELMYIRRQQRLEQEQADIEHEIRVIQSRPAVNRIDADKAREEQLVSRLVEIVRMRDELVQQIDAERRRERQEDIAIATSIANKRAQRNSDANSASMISIETIASPKKSKVKDKVKKQLKKAKHTLISKKRDEEKTEKPKKSK